MLNNTDTILVQTAKNIIHTLYQELDEWEKKTFNRKFKDIVKTNDILELNYATWLCERAIKTRKVPKTITIDNNWQLL